MTHAGRAWPAFCLDGKKDESRLPIPLGNAIALRTVERRIQCEAFRLFQYVALFLSALLISSAPRMAGSRFGGFTDDAKMPLQQALSKSYSDLFDLARNTPYSNSEINELREGLEKSEDLCVSRYKQQASQYAKDIEKSQKELKDAPGKITNARRHELHCQIQNLRALQSEAEMLAKHAIPIAYQNRKAKLDLIEQWPSQFKQIAKQLEDESYRDRRWGNVEDIGFREIEAGQQNDIKDGQEAIREMKAQGLMPKEIENREVTDYIAGIARRLASHSDLRVPLKVTVLDSKEINASRFARWISVCRERIA